MVCGKGGDRLDGSQDSERRYEECKIVHGESEGEDKGKERKVLARRVDEPVGLHM